MANRVTIQFEINCNVQRRSGTTVALSDDYVKGIENYIPNNGRKNCQGNFASELGEIILNKRKVLKRKNGVTVELNVTCEKMVADDIENINEIIWAIMPSCYSENESDIFTFNKAGSESNNYYKLIIEDVPQNITYKLLD